MPNMTLSIPKDLHSIIKKHNEIRWSEVARRAMWLQAKKLEIMDSLAKKSKLKKSDVDELDHIIKKGILRELS